MPKLIRAEPAPRKSPQNRQAQENPAGKFRTAYFLMLVAFSLLPRPTAAQDGRLEAISQLGGPSNAATAHAGMILSGIGPRLVIMDACDPAWPIELARSEPLGGIVQDVAARDQFAYVALGNGGLDIFDLGRITKPERIGHVELEGVAAKVLLQGDHAYVSAGAKGMSIVDIRDPRAPAVVGRFVDAAGDAVIATDIALGGSFAYVVSRNLMQVDIRDPAHPFIARKVEDWADAVAVEGQRLYVATSEQGERGERFGHLRVYDLSVERGGPRLIAALPVGDRARRIHVENGMIYHQGSSRLLVLRHDGAGGLQLLGAVATPDSVLNLDRGGRWIWQAAGPAGLRAIDVAGAIDGARSYSVFTSLSHAERVTADPDVAGRIYVEDQGADPAFGPRHRILIVDTGDPAAPSPTIVGAVEATVEKGAMIAHAGHLYVGAPGETLRIFDVRQPGAVREVASMVMPPDPLSGRRAPIWRIAIEGELAYLANDEWIRVLDIGNPSAPRQVAAHRSSGGATDIAVLDQRAYLLGPSTGVNSNRPSLQVVDFFDLQDPLSFGTRDAIGWRGGIAVEGQHVYIEGLQIVDVSDPDALAERAAFVLEGRNRDLAVQNGFVFLARSTLELGGYLRVYDARDPLAPTVTADLELVDEARDVALGPTHAYIAAQGSGLVIASHGPLPTPWPEPTAHAPRASLGMDAYLPVVSRGGVGRRN
jgi:hypothetical protein